MQKIFIVLILFLVPSNYLSLKGTEPITLCMDISVQCHELYHEMDLAGLVNYGAFEQAVAGYNKIQGRKKDVLTLIDFTKPSTEERLFVLDMKNQKILFSSHVSHGRNSGDNYATSFSNKSGSYKSSLGFYLTENTYQGKNGYSLILNGLEKNINDKAKERAIVMHGAPYANPSVINSSGRLGRSLGCPALPLAVSKTIIDVIKGGSLLYIYANNEDYLAQSTILPDSGNM
ncbi:MAG: murein L,D-transpeptidase catalytic domain family protein [Tannerella sp.]|jgi:hypothetical protein|nr:murein L,D-transpeptidase catalytic domain family protein [Tannerella sp.]